MPVIVPCPSCRSRIKVPGKIYRSGRTINCPNPKCKTSIDLAAQTKPEEIDVELASTAPLPTTLICPHCQGQISYDASLAGKAVCCPYPTCGGQFLMPIPTPTPAISSTAPVGAGSLHVNVFARPQIGRFHSTNSPQPDVGAVVVLIPKDIAISVPAMTVMPDSWREKVGPFYLKGDFNQGRNLLMKSGGYAALVAVDGGAVFSSVRAGDYTIVILSNTERRMSGYRNIHGAALLPPGLEAGDDVLLRHFSLDNLDSKKREMTLKQLSMDHMAHDGEVSIIPGEQTPYDFTF